MIWHSLRDERLVSIKIAKFDPLPDTSSYFFPSFSMDYLFFLTENGEKIRLCNVKLSGCIFLFLLFIVKHLTECYGLECIAIARKAMEQRNKCNGYAGNQFLTIKMSMGFQYLTTFLHRYFCLLLPLVGYKSARDFRIAHSLTSVSQVEGKSQGQPFR